MVQKHLKRSKKLQKNCQQQLEKCLQWQQAQHEALLLQAHQHLLKKEMEHVALADWENEGTEIILKLNRELTPRQEIEARFRRAKKDKAGIPALHRALERVAKTIQQIERALECIEQATDLKTLHKLQKEFGYEEKRVESNAATSPKKSCYHEFETEAGLKILVGKTAKDNEKLTFSLARGSDWWLHVRDFAGSHVIIRCLTKTAVPDPESLNDALQVALHYSKAKDKGEADICVTQCKHLTRPPRGKTGQVQLSKHKVMHVVEDRERLERLKRG